MEKIKYNLNVIYILWLRQVKRHLRSRSRVVASIGQPLIFLVALGFGFKSVFSMAGQGNYVQFLAPGIVAMSIMFSAMFAGIEVISDKQFGFLKETLVAPVSRVTIMLGRTLGSATMAVFQGLMVMIISIIFGFLPHSIAAIFLAILFMLIIAVFFTSLGTALASFFDDMHAFPIIMNFIIMPLFFLSGALFPVEGLPKGMNWVLKINPLTYGVDGLRGALIGQFHFSLATDLIVLIAAAVLILFFGGWLFRKIQV